MEVRVDTKRLIQLLQEILNTEEELQSDGVLDFGEDGDIPDEALLPRPIITDFYIEISKLKSANLASEVFFVFSIALSCVSKINNLSFIFAAHSIYFYVVFNIPCSTKVGDLNTFVFFLASTRSIGSHCFHNGQAC